MMDEGSPRHVLDSGQQWFSPVQLDEKGEEASISARDGSPCIIAFVARVIRCIMKEINHGQYVQPLSTPPQRLAVSWSSASSQALLMVALRLQVCHWAQTQQSVETNAVFPAEDRLVQIDWFKLVWTLLQIHELPIRMICTV
jgi:hypothetical protein